MNLQCRKRRRIALARHADEVEEIDRIDDAVRAPNRVGEERGLEVGASGRQRRLLCAVRPSGCSRKANDIRIRSAIVEELPHGITERRARIQAAEATLVIGEARDTHGAIVGPCRGAPNEQRDRCCDAADRLRSCNHLWIRFPRTRAAAMTRW